MTMCLLLMTVLCFFVMTAVLYLYLSPCSSVVNISAVYFCRLQDGYLRRIAVVFRDVVLMNINPTGATSDIR